MLVQTQQQFEAARTILLDAKVIAIDTETNGLRPFEGHRIAGISTYCEVSGMEGHYMSFYFPFRHKPGSNLFDVSENLPIEWLRELAPCFEKASTSLIFHNAKFDLHMLWFDNIKCVDVRESARKAGLPVGIIHDTAVQAQLINEEEDHDLDALGMKYFADGKVIILDHKNRKVKKGDYWKLAPATIEPYACKDAELTFKLFYEQEGLLRTMKLHDLYTKDETEFTLVLYEMERYGIAVDSDLAVALSRDAQGQMRELEDQMGFDPGSRRELARRLFSDPPVGLGLQPPVELTKDVSPDFPSGVPVMDEATLNRYEGTPLVDFVLQYRGLVKANSTWYDGFRVKSQYDGRLHALFNQLGTVTSRISCSHPNLQQMPRNAVDTPAKKLLVPDPGYCLIEVDYDQIEARIGCIYAKATVMIEAFRNGDDVHQVNADAIGVDRQTSKQGLYTIQYGGGVPVLAAALSSQYWLNAGIRKPAEDFLEPAQNFMARFHDTYPGFKECSKKAEARCKSTGYVTYWNGRQRHMAPRFCKMHKRVCSCHMRKAFNSICQGGASQIINESMRRLHRELDPRISKMVLQVHDSLWFQVLDNEGTDDFVQEIIDIMEWPHREGVFPVPITCSAKRMSDTMKVEATVGGRK